MTLRGADVGVRGSAVAVLEDLDPDDDRVGGRSGQTGEVAADEAVSAIRGAGGELGDSGGRDIHAGQVQAAGDQRQVVAAVAAADIQAPGQARLPRGREDVAGEGDRRLAAVAPAAYSASQAAAAPD